MHSTSSLQLSPPQLSPQGITMRLEAYLLQLSDVRRRWQEWLTEMQSAAVAHDSTKLDSLHTQSKRLNDELREVVESRQRMIDEAREAGWQVRTLRNLAERLPAWNRPKFRAAFMAARNQLELLRRLHIATWVFMNQTSQHFQEITLLMSHGSLCQSVYECEHSQPLEGGGQLLDSSL